MTRAPASAAEAPTSRTAAAPLPRPGAASREGAAPSRIAGGLIYAGFAALYLWTFGPRSDGVILGNDVLPYAFELAARDDLFLSNPHHLLFHPLTVLVRALLRLSGSDLPPVLLALRAHQVVSALGGALSVLVVFRMAARFAGLLAPLLLASVYGLAAGTWLYSSVGETYLPANAAIAGLLATAIAMRMGWREARALPLAAWLMAAVLLRQDSVIVVPILPLLVPPRIWAPVLGWSGGLVLAIYLAAWKLGGIDASFVGWVRGLSETGLWGHVPDARALRVTGWLTLVSLDYGLVHPPFWRALGYASWGLLAAGILGRWDFGRRRGRVALALLAFLAVRLLFYAWWQPGNMEFHCGNLYPLALPGGVRLGRSSARPTPRARRLRMLALAACLVITVRSNWAVLIAPHRDDEVARRSALAIGFAGEGGLVLSLDRLQHYGVAREEPVGVRALDVSDLARVDPDALPAAERAAFETELAALRSQVEATIERGGKVVLVRDLVIPERLNWAENPVQPAAIEALAAGFRGVQLKDERARLWAYRLEAE